MSGSNGSSARAQSGPMARTLPSLGATFGLGVTFGLSVTFGLGAICCLGAACGLVDLRPVGIVVFPERNGQVLDSREAGLSVRFSSSPLRLEAERAFSVASPDGAVAGDFSWDGDGFSWRPLAPWDPGVRYRLSLSGLIGMEDGRSLRADIDRAFFALHEGARPVLESFEPADGASVPVSRALTLRFSQAVDPATLKEALSVRPAFEYDASWDELGRVVTVRARRRLAPCTLYSWSLGTALRGREGAPLARAVRACFYTGDDAAAPSVARTYPAFWDGEAWLAAGESLAELEAGQGVAVLFSEDMEADSVKAGLRVEAGPPGRVEMVSPRLAVYRPLHPWEPETRLRLVVSSRTLDLSGLGLTEDFIQVFSPALPWLVLEEAVSGAEERLDTSEGPASVTVGQEPEGLLAIRLRFSAPFDAQGRKRLVEELSLSSVFPAYAPQPRLRGATWFSSDTLSLCWEGLRRSDTTADYYYELRLPGGPAGIRSAEGLRLRTDVELLARTLP